MAPRVLSRVRWTITLVVLALAMPAASAFPYTCSPWPTTNYARACAGDSVSASDCETGPEGRAATEASFTGAVGGIRVVGQEGCTAGGSYNQIVVISCTAAGGCLIVAWSDTITTARNCSMSAYFHHIVSPGATVPCMIAPPNPGWGHVLP